jgi:hypothetical protein
MPHARDGMREEPASSPSSHQPCSPWPYWRLRDRTNAAIVEAVCRDLLRQLAADEPPPLRYYLALRGGDPDAALLRRLQTVVPGIAPRSQCRVSANIGVADRATGVAGAILEVTRVSWRSATMVRVISGYYATPWHAAAFRYHVKTCGGLWAVTSAHTLWRVSPLWRMPAPTPPLSHPGHRMRPTDDAGAPHV